MSRSVKAQGIECPMIRQGDNLVNIVVDSVLNETKVNFKGIRIDSNEGTTLGEIYRIDNKDIIAVTESVFSRAEGLYVTVDDIARETEKFFGKNADVFMLNAIYSRNRHSMILRGIARACREIIFVKTGEDSQGNPWGVNKFTGVSIPDYYKQICDEEGCIFVEVDKSVISGFDSNDNIIDCDLHTRRHHNPSTNYYYLTDFCRDKNPDFGLLGTNISSTDDEILKLFPTRKLVDRVCREIKNKIKENTGKDVYVIMYGDGCFHSPYQYDENNDIIKGTHIDEEADPVCWLTTFEDTPVFESCPNEVKVKYLADNKYKDLSGEELTEKVREEVDSVKESLKGTMVQQGCTPRPVGDLIASLCDLMSGSGDRCTPVVLVQNYF